MFVLPKYILQKRAISKMALETPASYEVCSRAVGRSKIREGGGGHVVGIICIPGWERVNWSAKSWRGGGGIVPPQTPPVLTALSSFERFSRFLLMNIDQYRSVLLVFTLLNDVCLVLFGILGSWITNRPLSTLKTSSHAIIQHNMSILQVLRSQQIKYNQGVCM